MKKEFFINKRRELAEKLDNNSAALFLSGEPVTSSGDQFFNFEVSRNFYYLTGTDIPHSALLIIKKANTCDEYLFVQPKDETKEKWTGILPTCEEYSELSGIPIDRIKYIHEFYEFIKVLNEEYVFSKIYLDLKQHNEGYELMKPVYENMAEKITDISDLLFEMRAVKSNEEIAEISESIKITHDAISKFAQQMKPGIKEYQLKSAFEYEVAYQDAKLAFGTICAADKNAVILHYPYGYDEIDSNSMVLLDCGAAKKYYCADVTRTLPVCGEFTEKQKLIYEIVLKANKLVIEKARPGETLFSLNEEVKKLFFDELKNIGLVQQPEDVVKYYYHSVSHSLGLDTHDPLEKTTPLCPGMVITDEPGLYIKEWNIGVRIEDDLLITENGCEVLTKEIPKDVDEIKYMFR